MAREETPLDQETFDKVLADELAKGTDRRVAEGRARSAAVKAHRIRSGEAPAPAAAPAASGGGGATPAPAPAAAPTPAAAAAAPAPAAPAPATPAPAATPAAAPAAASFRNSRRDLESFVMTNLNLR